MKSPSAAVLSGTCPATAGRIKPVIAPKVSARALACQTAKRSMATTASVRQQTAGSTFGYGQLGAGAVAAGEGTERDETAALRRQRPQFIVRSLVGLAVVIPIVVTFSALLYPSGFGRSEPGHLYNLSGQVSGSLVVEGAQRGAGSFSFTTVRTTELSGAEYLWAKLRSDDIVRLIPNTGTDLLAMARASEAASVAATQYLRRETSPKGGAAFAAEPEQSPGIEAGSVPRNVIDGVGDVVDPSGQAFTNERGPSASASDVQPLLLAEDGRVGKSATRDDEGPLGAQFSNSGPDAGETPRFDVPTSGVGGWSAGLLMALAFLDAALPGDLTAGLDIAGTGTVNADGNVGGIVGTTLKLEAAEDADTDVFFIPAANLDDLGDEGTTVLVVSVETLGDAVDWLCQAGATDDLCADTR